MLTDEQILAYAGATFFLSQRAKVLDFGRAIEAAATAPLLARIAWLEYQLSSVLADAARVVDDLPAPDSCNATERSLWDVATTASAEAIRSMKPEVKPRAHDHTQPRPAFSTPRR